MTANQYWDEDSTLTKYYREAEEIRKERVNNEAWLQGMYIYDGILRLSPILRAFAKKGTKPVPYVDEAYPITEKAIRESEKEKERKEAEKGKMYMEALMASNNKHFEERK